MSCVNSYGQKAEIVFAGDAMQHKAQVTAAYNVDGSYTYRECFTNMDSIISAADYAVVNLETPLAGPPYRGYPNFSAPDSYAEALKNSGFDLFLTSNNHCLDCSDRGLRLTVDKLDEIGISHIGTYHNKTQRDSILPFIVNINGFKVGFLNYTYGTNGIEPQTDVCVDLIDKALISRDIANTRKAGAEILCVAMHWGDEYILLPNNEEKRLAKFLKDEGVDIIFGGHPHVIQPMELEMNPATGRNTILIYSLGNYISNMQTRDTRGGAIAKVVLQRDCSGNPYVASSSYKLIFTVPPQQGQKNYFLSEPDKVNAGQWEPQKNAFTKKATEIFDQHNINITPWE